MGTEDGRVYLWIAIAVGLVALALALLLARQVIASDSGTLEMQVISNAIREGAEAFLKRQYQTIGIIALVLAIVVFAGYHLSARTAPYAAKTVISFLVGAICSGLAGFTGMYCSIRANHPHRVRRTHVAGPSAQDGAAWRCGHRPASSSRSRCSASRRCSCSSAVWKTRRPFPTSWSASASAPRSLRSSPSSAAASTPRPPT